MSYRSFVQSNNVTEMSQDGNVISKVLRLVNIEITETTNNNIGKIVRVT